MDRKTENHRFLRDELERENARIKTDAAAGSLLTRDGEKRNSNDIPLTSIVSKGHIILNLMVIMAYSSLLRKITFCALIYGEIFVKNSIVV